MVNFFMHCSFVSRRTLLACTAFSTGIADVAIHTVKFNALAVEMLCLYILGNRGKKKFFRDGGHMPGEKCYS